MAARLVVRTESRRERLRRLSVVFAVELRLKIVTELYGRLMSPTQFFNEFGGGDVPRVARNFKKLEEHGWLRYNHSVPGPGGRGVERFYRAPELAFFDAETWALIPYSMRVASSWNILNQIAPRLREAMEASSSTRRDRDLTCTQLALDQIGWKRVREAVDAQFVALYDAQEDARLRVSHAEDTYLFRADVFLIAFESAGERGNSPQLPENRRPVLTPFHERLSWVFADEVCMRIVEELNRRPMSVKQFYGEIGGAGERAIYRRFRKLREIGWIERVDVNRAGRRRGASEYVYRAAQPPLPEKGNWAAGLSNSLPGTGDWNAFKLLCAQLEEAMRAGTFDRRIDRYAAWSILSLDQQSWEDVVAGLERLAAFIVKEQARAKRRMAETCEKPISMTIALAAFEASKDSIKAF